MLFLANYNSRFLLRTLQGTLFHIFVSCNEKRLMLVGHPLFTILHYIRKYFWHGHRIKDAKNDFDKVQFWVADDVLKMIS